VALAQAQATDEVQGPVFVGTVLPTADATATDVSPIEQPDTTAPPAPPIDTAVAGVISSLPVMFAFAALLGLVVYLIRDRKQITAMLATAIPVDMATSIVDTAIKAAFSALHAVNRMVPGELDDKIVERLATDAGLVRVLAADGSLSWQPLPTELNAPGTNASRPYAGMERFVLPDGTHAYKPGGTVAGQSRKFNDDGSYTLDGAG